ncbi:MULTISPECIES: hypothetical protein [Paenibacillus]|uniref:Uncharacterized protein n=1 Tax=Paenibacillus baimaensis TaxID=2982185 RepID=A0ABT2USG3_9BACL|nr:MULTISPECIES: hypothetical protein [unclassified Paenibacillus]MCU6797615.1 hypothetical protein [Paenibacillus sp. WQ 127069]OMF18560.1 hypothetical protein BK127_08840 [Paenibacillus sp. FSL H7-0331]
MILYQMAKRMEQRKKLQHTIEQSEGIMAQQLVTQKEQVEAQLMTQANYWAEEGNDDFMLSAMVPEVGGIQTNTAGL